MSDRKGKKAPASAGKKQAKGARSNSLDGKKAVVVYNKKDDKNVLYWLGKKVSFLNTHERKNNHGMPGFESEITGFQYVPNNGIVMVKGSYAKGGDTKKLSKIVGTLASDQSMAEDYVKKKK